MNDIKKNKVDKKSSKVLDNIKSISNKINYKYLYNNSKIGDIIKTEDKKYFIKSKNNNIIVCESYIKDDTIKIDKHFYYKNVTEVIWIGWIQKNIIENQLINNLWVLPIEWESIEFSYINSDNIYKWTFTSVSPCTWNKPSILVDTLHNNFEVKDSDIIKINDIKISDYKNFYYNFWKVFEKWLSITILIKDWPSFNNENIESIKSKSDWSTLITVSDHEDSHYDVDFNQVESIDGTDYTKLDLDYTLVYKDWDYENFSDMKDVTDFIENILDWNLNLVESIIEVPVIDDFYLEGREVNKTEELRAKYFYPNNIIIEDINDWIISELKKYKITGYQEAKSITKFKGDLSLENDIEHIEKLFKENSFYVYNDMIHIYFIIDQKNEEIIISETNNDWEIYYDLDDINECFWLNSKSLKNIVINEIHNISDKNKLINDIWKQYWVETDSWIESLRKIFNWYKIQSVD